MVKKASKTTPKEATKIEIPYKWSHNYLGIFEKLSDIRTFDSIIDTLSSTKYKTLLNCNATVNINTQREFWKNVTLEKVDKKVVAINSTIKGVKITITCQAICEVFELNDLECKNSFPKTAYQRNFIERGYGEEMKIDTLQKGSFPSATRFLFHTLLMCVSNKTTAFNEIPLKIQYLGYAILQDENFNYSQVIFNDLVKKCGENNFFIVSKVFELLLSEKGFQKIMPMYLYRVLLLK
ncbi:hypothetical protein Hanom_Chr08g00721081 [Helianthus anomalus]